MFPLAVVKRLRRLAAALRRSAGGVSLDRLDGAVDTFRQELARLDADVRTLDVRLATTHGRIEAHAARVRRELDDRAALAAVPTARLRSDAVTLDGSPGQRMRVARLSLGDAVELPFSRWMGVTRCATAAADVRAVWEGLLAFEASRPDDVLRGAPAVALDVPGGRVSLSDTLHVSLRHPPAPAAPVVAVPKCTYDFPARKLRNLGHWLLDCVPQVLALAGAAPDALFLLQRPLKDAHRAALALVGVDNRQIVAWDGAAIDARRLLVMESDGRIGRGRPLSPLLDMRRRLAAPAAAGFEGPNRRIYVSRRDAKSKRQWLSNERDVEALFQSRGFEVLVMADWTAEEQVQIFRQSRVVAGISGAGLADVVFAAAGAHVIVLLSDSLLRWYASEGARADWASGRPPAAAPLSALSDSPRFYAHLAAACGQWCHSFVGADQMPIDELGRFVDDVLNRVDRE